MHQLSKGYYRRAAGGHCRPGLPRRRNNGRQHHGSSSIICAGSAASAATALGLTAGCASTGSAAGAKVVVVGGATAAPPPPSTSACGPRAHRGHAGRTNDSFVSCLLSNLVLGGSKQMADITTPYDNLTRRHGVKIARDRATAIDADKAPGAYSPVARRWPTTAWCSRPVDFMWDALPGMKKAGAQDRVLHAWKARPPDPGAAQQLEAMPDGGVYAISIPLAPYRRPPGPYERACQVAHYFSQAKPKSKVLIPRTATTTSPPRARCSRRPGATATRASSNTAPSTARWMSICHQHAEVRFNDDVKAQVLVTLTAAARRRHCPQRRPDHGQQALVRGGLADHGVPPPPEHPHPGRCAADRAADAQVRPYTSMARWPPPSSRCCRGVRRNALPIYKSTPATASSTFT